MVAWGRVCFSAAGGFDSGSSFLAARLNRLVRGKRVVSKPWWLGVGSVFRLRVVSTRVARSSLPGSTGFRGGKLVEHPHERQRAGRVDTILRVQECRSRVCLIRLLSHLVAHVDGFAGYFALDVLHVVGA